MEVIGVWPGRSGYRPGLCFNLKANAMNISRNAIDGLELTPEIKSDILSLFDSIEEKESELTKLRAKIPTDSQRVVENTDYAKFESATAELEKLKQEMAKKIETPAVQTAKEENPDAFLAAFAPFFD